MEKLRSEVKWSCLPVSEADRHINLANVVVVVVVATKQILAG